MHEPVVTGGAMPRLMGTLSKGIQSHDQHTGLTESEMSYVDIEGSGWFSEGLPWFSAQSPGFLLHLWDQAAQGCWLINPECLVFLGCRRSSDQTTS